LINVTKHAGTDQAALTLMVDGDQTLIIVVEDRGGGYEPGSVKSSVGGSHFGLASIRERMSMMNGSCEEQSSVGVGTRITLRFPLTGVTAAGSLRAAHSSSMDRVMSNPGTSSNQAGLPYT
jgi:signal transduction histidine kinase